MGSRGSFLESGGFSVPAGWHTVGYVEGIKVIERKNPKASRSLPERSNTPGTAYVSYRKNGDFDQLRVFGEDRMSIFDIDYGKHDKASKTLHVHYFDKNYNREKKVVYLKKGDYLYEKYKKLFKGVEL